MILLSIGTNKFTVGKLLSTMDEIAPRLGEEVLMQIGPNEFHPKNTKCFSFVTDEEIKRIYDETTLFIGLIGGIGTMLNALTRLKPMILVNDVPEFIPRHEALEISQYYESRGWGIVTDTDHLEEAIQKARQIRIESYTPNTELADYLVGELDKIDRERKTR